MPYGAYVAYDVCVVCGAIPSGREIVSVVELPSVREIVNVTEQSLAVAKLLTSWDNSFTVVTQLSLVKLVFRVEARGSQNMPIRVTLKRESIDLPLGRSEVGRHLVRYQNVTH